MEFFHWSNIFIGDRLWEEKRNMIQRRSKLNQNVDGAGSGITETKNKFAENICENTTNEKKWKRNCPKCNKTIYYNEKWYRNKQEDRKTWCKSCSNHNKIRGHLLRSTKNKLKDIMTGRKPSLQARKNMSKAQIGRKHSKETREKMRRRGNGMFGVHRYGSKNPFHGKHHLDESRRKMRVAACKRVTELQRNNKDGRINNVGRREGEYFYRLEKFHGWDGIFYDKSGTQYLVEPLGYFVDYYEPNRNIVVEYDEPRHYQKQQLRLKDINRMTEIKGLLKCRFFRYNERDDVFIEY